MYVNMTHMHIHVHVNKTELYCLKHNYKTLLIIMSTSNPLIV